MTARRPVGAGLVLAAAVLVGACGGGSGDGAATTAAPAPTTTAPTSSTASTTSTTEATTTSTTTTAPTTTTTTLPPAPERAPEVGDLQAGAAGPRTYRLQQRLSELHYDPGPHDGEFGTKTTMAVWAFQALHGVPRTGVVDAALEQAILGAAPQAMLRPDLGPTHTEVDLTRQVLLVFRDGGVALITHVSSGTGQDYCDNGYCGTAITPVGDYRWTRRISGWRTSVLGRLYNPVYFVGGVAVHGAASVPNHPASHGCVRIPMHIAEYFPGLVANGDSIGVFRS